MESTIPKMRTRRFSRHRGHQYIFGLCCLLVLLYFFINAPRSTTKLNQVPNDVVTAATTAGATKINNNKPSVMIGFSDEDSSRSTTKLNQVSNDVVTAATTAGATKTNNNKPSIMIGFSDEDSSRSTTKLNQVSNNIVTAATTAGATEIKNNKPSIMIGFSDNGYKEIAWKWYQEIEKLGYDEHQVVAHDPSSAEYFKEKGMRYDVMSPSFNTSYYLEGPNCIQYVKDNFSHGTSRIQYHRQGLFGSRWNYILRRLIDGYDVLVSDVDNVFVRYVPLSQLKDSQYDAYHAYAGMHPIDVFRGQGFTICGGMSWFRSTPGVIEFVRSIARDCGCEQLTCFCYCDDQLVINGIIYDSEYKIDWDEQDMVIPETVEEMSWEGKTGTCNKTGHRVKIWNRHTAYRAAFDAKKCPNENNWIAMPSQINRTAVWEIWREGCGINQSNTINHTREFS